VKIRRRTGYEGHQRMGAACVNAARGKRM
jgi:hypothetical protein